MGGDGRDDDGARGISSHYRQIDCSNDTNKGRQRGMVVRISGHGIGSYKAVSNKGAHEEAEGNNNGVCSKETNIQNLYRSIEDGGFQQVNNVVGPRTWPKTGGEGGMMKDKIVPSINN